MWSSAIPKIRAASSLRAHRPWDSSVRFAAWISSTVMTSPVPCWASSRKRATPRARQSTCSSGANWVVTEMPATDTAVTRRPVGPCPSLVVRRRIASPIRPTNPPVAVSETTARPLFKAIFGCTQGDCLSDAPRAGKDCEKSRCPGTDLQAVGELVQHSPTANEVRRSCTRGGTEGGFARTLLVNVGECYEPCESEATPWVATQAATERPAPAAPEGCHCPETHQQSSETVSADRPGLRNDRRRHRWPNLQTGVEARRPGDRDEALPCPPITP